MRIHEPYRQLREIGFVPKGQSNPNWFTCVVVSMLVQPGTQRAIVERAQEVARVLGLSIEKDPAPVDKYPCFHFGYAGTAKYFETHEAVGQYHTVEDIEPYCATHSRSWRSNDPCN